MKILYIECGMGAAGDMLMSALSELMPNQNEFVEKLNSLKIPSVVYKKEKTEKCGLVGTHISVLVDGEPESEATHEHHRHAEHRSMNDIEHTIEHLDLPDNVRSDVLAVYKLIAEAEGAAHGRVIDEVHFHEVGTMDAIADICGVCMLMDALKPDKIVASPIHVGCGTVKCAHGILPVPAPATAYLLKNIPIYGGEIKGELCTPTGAALLRHFADEFGNMPIMRVSQIGCGMGTRNYETANCMRVMFGESEE